VKLSAKTLGGKKSPIPDHEITQPMSHGTLRELSDPKWMYLKGALLLLILLCSAGLLLTNMPSWRTGALLVLVVWASARLYYFMFYVIEHYIDSSYRFSGVLSALSYLLRRSTCEKRRPPGGRTT
jgi:hypothetical protein